MAKEILLAEDGPEAEVLFRLVLKRNRVENPVLVVHDGKEAIQYLAGEGKFADRAAFPLPEVLCLDIRMPLVDGFGVLEWLQSHPTLKAGLLIIVLSEDNNVKQVRRAYDLGAQSFLEKPLTSGELANVIQHFPGHWLVSPKPEKPG